MDGSGADTSSGVPVAPHSAPLTPVVVYLTRRSLECPPWGPDGQGCCPDRRCKMCISSTPGVSLTEGVWGLDDSDLTLPSSELSLLLSTTVAPFLIFRPVLRSCAFLQNMHSLFSLRKFFLDTRVLTLSTKCFLLILFSVLFTNGSNYWFLSV